MSSFSYVGAQETSVSNVPLQKNVQQPQATLIADVNFDNIKATSSKGVLLVSFSIKSSFGNVNNVTYGVSVSSKKLVNS